MTSLELILDCMATKLLTKEGLPISVRMKVDAAGWENLPYFTCSLRMQYVGPKKSGKSLE